MATVHARTKKTTAVLTAADEYTQAVAAQVAAAEDLCVVMVLTGYAWR